MSWFEIIQRSFFDWQAMAAVLPNMIAVGLKNTLLLAVASTLLGIAIGLLLAVMGISRSAWIRTPARVYTDIFRGLPAIVTILLIGQGFRPHRPAAVRSLALPARHPGAQPHRRRLHRRDLSLGHPERRARAARGLPGARHDLPEGHAADRDPARGAARAAGAGEPVHRQHQGFEPRLLPRPARLRARVVPGRAGSGGSVRATCRR